MMSEFKIEVINSSNEKIEAFLRECGTVFHSHAFLSSVGEDYKCVAAISNSTGCVVGCLPLVKSKKFGLKSYHIPPFAYQFGPVIDENFKTKSSKILTSMLNSLRKEKHLDFKIIIEDGNILPFKEMNFTCTSGQTHVFLGNSEYGLNVLSKDKARDVKKLLHLNEEGYLKVTENDQSNLHFILKMWKKTSDRAKFNAHMDTLEQIFSSKVAHYSNTIFDYNGVPLAGAYCPYDSKKMYHLIGASTKSTESVLNRSNILSLFLAITYANRRKLDFDFEGSNVPGVAKFYRMMGGKPKIIYRVQKTKSAYYHFLRGFKTYKQEQSW